MDFHMGKNLVSLGEPQGRYRMYMTMKARADRADISYSIDTQLDRAIAYALSIEERDQYGRREGDSQLRKDESEDVDLGRGTVSLEKADNVPPRLEAVMEQGDLPAESSQAKKQGI